MSDIEIDVTSEENLTVTPEELSEYENKLLDEKNRAVEAENTLRQDLETEISRAKDKENELQTFYNNINSELENCNSLIEKEEQRAVEAETVLDTDIKVETQRAKEEELKLNEKLSSIEITYNSEIKSLKENNETVKQDIINIKQANSSAALNVENIKNDFLEKITEIKAEEKDISDSLEVLNTKVENIENITETLSENYATKDELNNKVDKKEGYSLVSDEEIARVKTLKNYDDTKVKADIDHLDETKQEKGDYALKSELPEIPTRLSSFENDVNYLTEHQDISHLATKEEVETKQEKGDYALKNEIPDISHLATKDEIPQKVSELINDKNYIVEHQDISHLATKDELENKIDKKEGYDLISISEVERLASVDNYDDSEIISSIENIQIELEKNKDINVDNFYTKEEINSFLDTKANEKDIEKELENKINRESNRGLSSNDFTDAYRNKLIEIEEGAQRNAVTSVNGQTGDVTIVSSSPTENIYPFFCINSGTVDNNGNADFVKKNINSIMATAPFVYTTASGITYQVENNISLDLDSYSYGTYNLFVEKNNNDVFSLVLYKNQVSIQKNAPAEPSENDIWVETSIFPAKSFIYYRQTWVYTNLVHIGKVTITSSEAEEKVITIKLNAYNYTSFINFNLEEKDDDIIYAQIISNKSKKIIFSADEVIGPRSYQDFPNLRKIWIPSTIASIKADTAFKAPFLGCSSSCEIFTDILNEDNLPTYTDEETGLKTPLFSPYWNNRTLTEKIKVNYGSSMQEFNEFEIN